MVSKMRCCLLIIMVLTGCAPKPAVPVLRAVEPTFFDANVGTGLAMLAEGLLPPATLDFDRPADSSMPKAVVSAFIDDGTTRVELLDVQWVDSTRVTGRLAAPVMVGIYDVHLIEPRGGELVLPAALQALDCAEGDCPLGDGGLPDSGVVVCGTTSYRDRDLDGFGAGGASMLCGAGWVPLAGDCDDRDSLTFPGATEQCNGLDDDCNGVLDDTCGAAGWTQVDELRAAGNHLLASASFAPGSLWIAAGSKVFIGRGLLGFADVSTSCPADVKAVCAEPGGEAELGGGNSGAGRIVEHSLGASACSNERAVAEPPVAMVGFQRGAEFQNVAMLRDGRLLRWRRGQAPVISSTNLTSSAEVTDLHGVSPEQLIAVGSVMQGNNRRPMSWVLQSDGGWREESLTGGGNPNGKMWGVWALTAVDAIAVGENGRIFRRSASGWRQLSSETSNDLTSVRAFSAGRFYVTTDDGRVRRRSGSTWQTLFRNDAGVRLNDLSGTSEEDLWVVGNDGVIGRGPQP